jgi:Transcriptional regulators of sugar metabolism
VDIPTQTNAVAKKQAFPAPLSCFDGIVTDGNLPEKTKIALAQQGIEVLLA